MTSSDFLELFYRETLKPKGIRYINLATNTQDFPNSRTVIIRKFDKSKHELIIYTHALSDKVQEIVNNPLVSLCWYQPKKQVQIQMKAHAFIVKDKEVIEDHFKKVNPHSMKDYLGIKPGSLYSNENNQDQHFCVIRFEISEYSFLQLGKEEHLKFVYLKQGGGFTEQRVIP